MSRLITTILLIGISSGALFDTVSSSQVRWLRMDEFNMHVDPLNSTTAATMTIGEMDGSSRNETVLEEENGGGDELIIQTSESNFASVTHSPTHAPSSAPFSSIQPTISLLQNDDDSTAVGNMTNWLTPVTLYSTPSKEEMPTEHIDISSNSTTSNSSYTDMQLSMATSTAPQLNETIESILNTTTQSDGVTVNAPTFAPSITETFNSPTLTPSAIPTLPLESAAPSNEDNVTMSIDLANNESTSVAPTSLPTISQTSTSPILAPSATPTLQFETATSTNEDNVTVPINLALTESTSVAPTSLPTVTVSIRSPTISPSNYPSEQVDTPTLNPQVINTDAPIATPTYSPIIIEEQVIHDDGDSKNATATDSLAISTQPPTESPSLSVTLSTASPSFHPTQELPPTESPSLSVTLSTASPSFNPTPEQMHDEAELEGDNQKEVLLQDESKSSPTVSFPTYYPTYAPTMIGDAIYPKYYPTFLDTAEHQVTTDDQSLSKHAPTYYPTYSPTTVRRGKRVQKRKEKRKERIRRNSPSEAPTVVNVDFLEDLSASKTLPMVLGVLLTILGIGCCAWCM